MAQIGNGVIMERQTLQADTQTVIPLEDAADFHYFFIYAKNFTEVQGNSVVAEVSVEGALLDTDYWYVWGNAALGSSAPGVDRQVEEYNQGGNPSGVTLNVNQEAQYYERYRVVIDTKADVDIEIRADGRGFG